MPICRYILPPHFRLHKYGTPSRLEAAQRQPGILACNGYRGGSLKATLSSFYRHRWEAPTDSHEALSNSWVLEIMLARGMMKFLDREPVAVVSLAIGIFGFCIPLVVPPIRESMGLSTKQSNPTAELPKPRLAPGTSS